MCSDETSHTTSPLFLQKNTAGKFGAKTPKNAKPQQKNEHQKTTEKFCNIS
jgi:hypothetical protein